MEGMKINLKVFVSKRVDWILKSGRPGGGAQWPALVNAVINLRFHKRRGIS
jgi:hypothetical protein